MFIFISIGSNYPVYAIQLQREVQIPAKTKGSIEFGSEAAKTITWSLSTL